MPVPKTYILDHNILPWDEERIVFLHIPKTGGTSLRHLLTSAIGEKLVCPEMFNELPRWPAGLLARYKLFAGHYDHTVIDVIPGGRRKIVTMLRNPRDRIISLYVFWRIHRRDYAEKMNLYHVLLAKDNDFNTFLSKMRVRFLHDIDNTYARALGGKLQISGANYEPVVPLCEQDLGVRAVDGALKFLEKCAAVGILEDFPNSLRRISSALGLSKIQGITIELMKASDLVKNSAMYEEAEPPNVTEEAEVQLSSLTAFDRQIYDFALSRYGKITRQASAQNAITSGEPA